MDAQDTYQKVQSNLNWVLDTQKLPQFWCEKVSQAEYLGIQLWNIFLFVVKKTPY